MAETAADEELTIDVSAPLPDPTGNTRGTPPGNTSASARQGARRYQWTGPFTVPNPVFAGSWSGTEDVEMPTASPGGEGSHAGDGQDEAAVQYIMSNAPALPAAPKYSGSTLQEKREFMRAYQTYVHALSAFHTPTTKPYIMPVSACIEERTCNLICMYELNKDPSWVSEADRAWVSFALTCSKILDQHNVENIFFQKEQKKLIQYMVAALEPEDFRAAIRKRLTLEQHKDLRKDVVSCYKWILGLLVAYLQWNPPSIKQNRAPNRPQGGPTTSTASASSRRQPPSGKPSQLATQGRKSDKGVTPTESAQKGPKPVVECLKCKSTEHRVRQCPQVRPEEIDGLLAAWKASRAESRTQMRRVQAAATSRSYDGSHGEIDKKSDQDEDDGTAVAHIDGLAVQASLLDSGADDSLVSVGVVNKLTALGKFVAVKQCDTMPM
ncbi:Hypothetical protein PHPALM_12728 [Phytophthora palmivora]|uniref:Peptidase A2 domain-containing protein n=1 Tax=Phytophthora palmivora TaxID=4796 RepID=A0A2P4XYZ3_9STRA|nr:Hypothetical protein PHPALM_12728 [Phytophthora palmivora]